MLYKRETQRERERVIGKNDKEVRFVRANNRTNSNGRNNGIEVIAFRVTYARTDDGGKTSTV